MGIMVVTNFFGNLTLVVGVIYLLSTLMILFGIDFVISIQQKFFDLDKDYLKKVTWGYVAIFKLLFITFVAGPYIALLMMGS